jgi:hypothetical protein
MLESNLGTFELEDMLVKARDRNGKVSLVVLCVCICVCVYVCVYVCVCAFVRV